MTLSSLLLWSSASEPSELFSLANNASSHAHTRMHTHTHACTDTQVHTRAHAHTRTQSDTRTHTSTHTCQENTNTALTVARPGPRCSLSLARPSGFRFPSCFCVWWNLMNDARILCHVDAACGAGVMVGRSLLYLGPLTGDLCGCSSRSVHENQR